MAELVVRVALRGDMAMYRWEGRLPFERDVTPDYKPPQDSRKAAEPTEMLVGELNRNLGRKVKTFQFDSEELMLQRVRFADWDALNDAVRKALCAALPRIKKVRLVVAEPKFAVEERASRRTYTPPPGSKLVSLAALKGSLQTIEGLFVSEVRDKRVVVEPSGDATWRELHTDVVTVLGRFCN